MTLHEKAELGLLKGEVLTEELLNARDKDGNTVLHIAAKYKTYIPKQFMTEKALSQENEKGTRFGILPRHLIVLQIFQRCLQRRY